MLAASEGLDVGGYYPGFTVAAEDVEGMGRRGLNVSGRGFLERYKIGD